MHVVFLGLGSNLGDREKALCGARDVLAAGGVTDLRSSGVYETDPVGGPPQGPYLNAVVGGRTLLDPRALLDLARDAESRFGRVRGERNGPRTLDVDILLYDDLVCGEPGLSVPHPRLPARRFVLVPLAEIAPDVILPGTGLTVAQLLARCPDPGRVWPYTPAEVRS